MVKYVGIDDQITRVHADYIVCETVETVTRDGFMTKSIPGVTSLRHADEGATWVRGWHLPDSDDVKAARVALALAEKEAPSGPTPSQFAEMFAAGILQGLPGPPPPQPLPPSPQPAAFPGSFGPSYIGNPAVAPTTTITGPLPPNTHKVTC